MFFCCMYKSILRLEISCNFPSWHFYPCCLVKKNCQVHHVSLYVTCVYKSLQLNMYIHIFIYIYIFAVGNELVNLVVVNLNTSFLFYFIFFFVEYANLFWRVIKILRIPSYLSWELLHQLWELYISTCQFLYVTLTFPKGECSYICTSLYFYSIKR